MSQKGIYTTGVEWPLQIRARYAEVLSYPGIHYTMKAGTKFTSDPAKGLWRLPQPFYDGYVFRVFMYAGDNSQSSYTGIRYKSATNAHWTIRVEINGGEVFVFSIENKIPDTETKSGLKGNVKEGEVYTISMVTEYNRYFHANLNDNRIGTLDVTTIGSYNYDIWHLSGGHTLLSMHFSRESGQATNLGTELFLSWFHMPVGSYVTHDCVFTPTPALPNLIVYIRDREKWADAVDWTYVPQGQAGSFTCTVRRVPSNYVVFISFQTTPVQVAHPNPPIHNRLEVSFSSNVRQVQSHHVVPF